MVISREHHDLVKALEKANNDFSKATKAMKDYMSSGSVESSKALELTKLMSDASDKVMNLIDELDALKIDK